jgi:hypothetical protein
MTTVLTPLTVKVSISLLYPNIKPTLINKPFSIY